MSLLKKIPIPEKKKNRKKKREKDGRVFGLRKCEKCLQIKTYPNFDGDSRICDRCSRGEERGYADYIREAIIAESWKAKYPNQKPCADCRGIFPPFVMSVEFGRYICANCFLIAEYENEEKLKNGTEDS